MAFAGIELAESSVEQGSGLAGRLTGSELLPSDRMEAEVKLVRTEIHAAVENNLDVAVSFVLTAADVCESGQYRRNVFDFGRVAANVAMKIVGKDTEIGKRLLHDILTRQNLEFSSGVWAETEAQYKDGNLPYDDFNRFFLVWHSNS